MNATLWLRIISLACCLLIPVDRLSENSTSVVFVALNPSGRVLHDCRVAVFRLTDSPNAEVNLAERFIGLAGKDIPYDDYSTYITCGQKQGTIQQVSVFRPNQVIVVPISEATHGHALNLATPWLHVDIESVGRSNSSPRSADEKLLVGVIPVYGELREYDIVDPGSRRSVFYGPAREFLPGQFFVTVQNEDRLLCSKLVEISGVEAELRLRVGQSSCTVQDGSVRASEVSP
jgi:hypothetical protein